VESPPWSRLASENPQFSDIWPTSIVGITLCILPTVTGCRVAPTGVLHWFDVDEDRFCIPAAGDSAEAQEATNRP